MMVNGASGRNFLSKFRGAGPVLTFLDSTKTPVGSLPSDRSCHMPHRPDHRPWSTCHLSYDRSTRWQLCCRPFRNTRALACHVQQPDSRYLSIRTCDFTQGRDSCPRLVDKESERPTVCTPAERLVRSIIQSKHHCSPKIADAPRPSVVSISDPAICHGPRGLGASSGRDCDLAAMVYEDKGLGQGLKESIDFQTTTGPTRSPKAGTEAIGSVLELF